MVRSDFLTWHTEISALLDQFEACYADQSATSDGTFDSTLLSDLSQKMFSTVQSLPVPDLSAEERTLLSACLDRVLAKRAVLKKARSESVQHLKQLRQMRVHYGAAFDD